MLGGPASEPVRHALGRLQCIVAAVTLGSFGGYLSGRVARRPGSQPHRRHSSARHSPLPAASPVLSNNGSEAGEAKSGPEGPLQISDFLEKTWSGRRDSNPRPQPWQSFFWPTRPQYPAHASRPLPSTTPPAPFDTWLSRGFSRHLATAGRNSCCTVYPYP